MSVNDCVRGRLSLTANLFIHLVFPYKLSYFGSIYTVLWVLFKDRQKGFLSFEDFFDLREYIFQLFYWSCDLRVLG